MKMDWDRTRRFEDHRRGESYRPGSSRGYSRRSRSPPRIRSPPSRLVADTWVPSTARTYGRVRSRSPPSFRHRSSRSPPPYNRDAGPSSYAKGYSSRRYSPHRDGRARSPVTIPRRPRSPYGEDRARDTAWSQSTARRPREPSPAGRDAGYFRKERHLPSAEQRMRSGSPSRYGPSAEEDQRLTTSRARSPFNGGRRDHIPERFPGQRRRSPSPKRLSSDRTSAPGSISNSRRSSPLHDKANTTPAGTRSRSPAAGYLSSRCLSRVTGRPSNREERMCSIQAHIDQPKAKSGTLTTAEQGVSRRPSDMEDTGLSSSRTPETRERALDHTNDSYPSNAPSQPRAFSAQNQPSPSGPPPGPKVHPAQIRASNVSILSAPTRPRGSSNFKDSSWAGSSNRRGPTSIGSHGTPTGPRTNHISAAPSVEGKRHHVYRQGSVTGTSYSHTQRHTNHLVGLRSIIPGGKPFPHEFDTMTEKRLSQLDTDKDRIFEQIAASQRLKRAGLRDWDKLDRESSICALKSELAEGHLQCITDTDGALGRSNF